ncbi:MAG: hypothetical protein ABR551_06430 [Gemmatimonadales bacterium]
MPATPRKPLDPRITARNRYITIGLVVAFVGFLAWTMLSAQKATCDVCMDYKGRRNCASASAVNEEEALTSARNTACGPISFGMNESIECGNTPPATRVCRTR